MALAAAARLGIVAHLRAPSVGRRASRAAGGWPLSSGGTAPREDRNRWRRASAAGRRRVPPSAAAKPPQQQQEQQAGPSPQEHVAAQAAFFARRIGDLQQSITPEVEAKLARLAASIPGLSPDSRVLDAGAGTGALLPHLQACGVRDILAVDVSPAMLAAVQQRVGPASPLGNDACVRTWLGDVAELPAYQGPFDAAVFNAVWGNLRDPRDTLLRTCFLLRPGSYVVISHVLGRSWHEGLRREIPDIVPHELPQLAELQQLVADLPLRVVSVTDEEEFYLALLQVPEGYAHPAAPIRLAGPVVHGFGRGSRKLGVPTANLPPGPLQAQLQGLPDGVYFGWARLDVDSSWPQADRAVHKMVMNIGRRPTFGDAEPELSVEAHVLHRYSRDFYGEPMRLVAVGYIRPEMKFRGLPELLGRINADIGVARSQLDLPAWQAYAEQLAAEAAGGAA